MDSFNISAEKRISGSKGITKRIKFEGFIPGVFYSNGESMPISVNEERLYEIINKHGADVLLNLNFEGKNLQARFKEIQKHPVTQNILHIDIVPVVNEYPLGKLIH